MAVNNDNHFLHGSGCAWHFSAPHSQTDSCSSRERLKRRQVHTLVEEYERSSIYLRRSRFSENLKKCKKNDVCTF